MYRTPVAATIASMELSMAHALASRTHLGQRNRFGEAVVAHLERVASRVPPDVRALAWLHDVVERTDASGAELVHSGLTGVEMAVLELLTHIPGEPYQQHIERIAAATGHTGRTARVIKLAELEDHLGHDLMPPGAPPYAWARHRLIRAQRRRGERTL